MNNLLTSHVQSLQENLKPWPCRIDLAITWSIRQGPSLRFLVKASLSVSKQLIFSNISLLIFSLYFTFTSISFLTIFYFSWFSWNIGPAHIISFSTEVYYWLNYGIEQIVRQYDFLKKDLQVSYSTVFVCTVWQILLWFLPN